ncbi:Transposase DDE domain protein [Cardinium endosymbiont of Sogatella furcifera]|nr:Transposase DDE domain protein [Cardinium endosymbiont of Sogatella furcifera]
MEKHLLTTSQRKPTRTCSLNLSEIMTIIITFHIIGFKNFKTYYLHLQQFHANEFSKLVSYNRFIEFILRALVPLFFFTQNLPKKETGYYFMDSTAIKVCNIKRAYSHKVFKSIATKGKTSIGWFLGFSVPQMYAVELEM